MTRSIGGVAIALSAALLGGALTGCSQGDSGAPSVIPTTTPTSAEEESPEAPQSSEEARGVVAAEMGRGGTVYRTGNNGYQDEREWHLVSETQIQDYPADARDVQTDTSEYTYDGEGRLVSCVQYGDGAVEREDTWEYGDGATTHTTTNYEKSPEGLVTSVVTEQGDEGASVETTYDASGAVTQTIEVTREENADGYTRTQVRRDASGAVNYTNVRQYDGDGNLLRSTNYEGEPSESPVDSQYVYSYDEQGRDVDSYSEYPGSEYGSSGGETHTAYAEDGSSMTIDVDDLEGSVYAGMVTFYVTDADGRTVRGYRNFSPSEESVLAPTNSYVTYDEKGNPVLVVTEEGGSLVGKRTFNYDEEGNLISSVGAEFDNGEVEAVTYDLFQYENASTGEKTEVPAIDSLQIPELTGEDAELALNRYGDGPLDRVTYGEGRWEVELEPDEVGARYLIIDCTNIVPGQPLILAATTHEGGMEAESGSVGHYETMENGEVLLVTYTGTKLSLSDATEDTVRVRGTLADGTEVDATAQWMSW